VWKQKETQPVATLKMPGSVTWLDFVGPDRVAMLAFTPDAVVQVWDVAKGEVVKTVTLGAGQFEAARPPKKTTDKSDFSYDPVYSPAALSPSGRYVVLGGKKGPTLIDLSEGKEIGVFPVTLAEQGVTYSGLGFSPDGTRLLGVIGRSVYKGQQYQGIYFMTWDVATGKRLTELQLPQDPRPNTTLPRGRLLPGPTPTTLYYVSGEQTWLIDIYAGTFIASYYHAVLRWGRADQTLIQKQGIHTMPFDRAKFDAEAGTLLAGVTPRPAVAAADRSALQLLEPQLPAKWAAPAALDKWPARPGAPTVLGAWPTALGDSEGAVLTYVLQQKPRGRNELHWERLDLLTGKKLGRHVLWPWVVPMDQPRVNYGDTAPPPSEPPLAALSADGRQLAVVDPANPGRVDVWTETGTRLTGLEPCAGTDLDWLGWSAGGKLLVVAGGRLSAWEVSTGKGVYEIARSFCGPAVYGPARKWLAIAAADAVDLLDPDSGRLLGRLQLPKNAATPAELAIAPDGKFLAAARPGGMSAPKEKTTWTADIWDLSTGTCTSLPFGAGRLELLHWAAPRQLLAVSATIELIDLSAGGVVWVGALPKHYAPPGGDVRRLTATPDGRLWLNQHNFKPSADLPLPRVWRSLIIPNPQAKLDGLVLADDRQYSTASPIRVEVNAGDKERSLAVARNVAAELQRRGFTIGAKGWVLRVSHEVADSGRLFITNMKDKGTPIPMVKFKWQLLSPEGTEVWKAETIGYFKNTGSKYFVKSRVGAQAAAEQPGAARIDYFDFGSKGMRDAIVDEILEDDGPYVTLPAGVSKRLLKGQNAYHPVPLTGEITLDGQ
jgi:WD40 repeat protein